MSFTPPKKITVVGLGYVGLPLAVALSHHFNVVGYDIDENRIAELCSGKDRTGEVHQEDLSFKNTIFSNNSKDLVDTDVFIVAVPTPVDTENKPDLGALKGACLDLAPHLVRDAVVVFESTVYPGATENFCGPILEQATGMVCGKDFFLGYSPERMNPGDPDHTLENLVKIVSGQTTETTELLSDIYGKITKVYVAKNIATAEAAKVIENSQRDINIAFINEVTQIFEQLHISIYDVLDAANTKWNFLNFRPGLVGGHCIGVDPYYLAERAKQVGYEPDVLLSGRRINDGMASWIADRINMHLSPTANILMLGVTFKENVPDLRNSGAVGLIKSLQHLGHKVSVCDPYADPDDAFSQYNLRLLKAPDGQYDCVIGAVSHQEYKEISRSDILNYMPKRGLLADIKGMWRDLDLPPTIKIWRP